VRAIADVNQTGGLLMHRPWLGNARRALVPTFAALLAPLAILALPACSRDAVMAPRALAQPISRGVVTSHVVIVSIDGLRVDAVAQAVTPTLWRLAHEGSYTLSARTIMPSITLPSHTSMLTGVTPEVHGVTWNTDERADHSTVAVPTVFGVAHARGLRTAAFFSKTKFHHLEVPGTLDHWRSPADGAASFSAKRTIGDVARYLGTDKPNLLFVHVGEPDYAGHRSGWMSPAYLRAVRAADDAVARLIVLLDDALGAGEYTLLVTADHGGHARTHGSRDVRDVLIPWLAWGEGVRPGTHLGHAIRTMDTAATALWLLGVAVPEGWSGIAVAGAFAPRRVVEAY
jgi:arylsulfatase A-like enzyme